MSLTSTHEGLQLLLDYLGADRPHWHHRAACRGLDPDLFFPGRGQSTTEARAVCAGCPVRQPCRDFAVTNGERFGIWGQTSERQRRSIRRGSAA